MSGRRQKVQVKWSGWKRRPRADTHRPVTGRPHVAHRDPRRAWKWFSHSGRPSCSKKLPPEKGAKHSVEYPADETVRMPERTERRDVVVQNGALTTLAARREQL